MDVEHASDDESGPSRRKSRDQAIGDGGDILRPSDSTETIRSMRLKNSG